MKKIFVFFLLLSLFPALMLAQVREFPVFISTEWLGEHINDPSLVMLHVSIRRGYTKGHIPGARFLWSGSMVRSNPDLSSELVPVSELDTLLEGLGISNNSRIILYGDAAAITTVSRMFVTLDYLGMGERTSILDGGIEAWKAKGYQVTTEAPSYKRQSFTPKINSQVFAGVNYVKSNLHQPNVSIIDVRSPQLFNGTNPQPNVRAGHIPGSVNIPYGSLVDSLGRLIPVSAIEGKLDNAGVTKNGEVITYCNVGMAASLIYTALKQVGVKVRLYDGSFEEWSVENLPLEVLEKKEK